jgi:hypothetical protein
MSKSHNFSRVFLTKRKAWACLTLVLRQDEHRKPEAAGNSFGAQNVDKTSVFSKPEDSHRMAVPKVVPTVNRNHVAALIPVAIAEAKNPGREVTLHIKSELSQRLQVAISTCEHCVSYSVRIPNRGWISVHSYTVNGQYLIVYQIFHLTTPLNPRWDSCPTRSKTPGEVAKLPLVLIRQFLDRYLGRNNYFIAS